MKDDERQLLAAAQSAGEFVPLESIKVDRCEQLLKSWVQQGWVDSESGRLTSKGQKIKVQALPVEQAAVVASVPIVSESQSVVMDDWDDYAPEGDLIEEAEETDATEVDESDE